MRISSELSRASDEQIARSLDHADPLVLRGLLYQLTGDEGIATMPLVRESFGYSHMDRLANDSDVAMVRQKMADMLIHLRDSGAADLDIGPMDRLPRSLEMIAGTAIPKSELEMWIEETGLDPLARGLKWKNEPSAERKQEFFVVVIGGGISGINAAVHLKSAGIPFILLEKNKGVGGTWFENRYPGIRVDSPSRGYLHLFGLEFPYPYSFCPGEENVRYLNWIVDRYGLAEHIVYETEVRKTLWDEDSQTWDITAEGPEGAKSWRANAVISCVGFLSRPKMPDIEGLDSFTGVACHSAQWPDGLDVKGKRVAVIGSGASAYQMTPVIAKTAKHAYLFQRTPSWCYATPSYISPLPDEAVWVDQNVPFYVNFARFRMGRMYGPDNTLLSQRVDPNFEDPHARSPMNKKMRESCVAFLHEKLASRPDLAEKMIPTAPPMTSRPIRVDIEDNIYTALLEDNVSLVSDRIERITPNGIKAGGEDYELDIIILATGFKANDFLFPMEVRGRGGRRVEELWAKDGPRAYIGAMLPGFPNFFMAYGPNTNNFGGLQVIDLLEIEIRFALQSIAGLIENQRKSVDVKEDAYWRFNKELDAIESQMIYMDQRVMNYYKNEHNRSCVNGPIDIRRMWSWLRDPAGPPRTEIDAGLQPWFGGDLVVS